MDGTEGLSPSQRITNYIAGFTDWRGLLAARLRTLIVEAVPSLSEEWKWGVPVFAAKGNVVAIGIFKDHVKLNFFKGASLADPHGLFNASLEAQTMRAIDIHEGDTVNEPALTEMVAAAVVHNSGRK